MSDDQLVVTWEDRGGFVYVAGKKVLGGDGSTGVKVRTNHMSPCQRCKEHNIEHRLILWCRYESATALRRMMYWFGLDPRDRYGGVCAACQAIIDGVIT